MLFGLGQNCVCSVKGFLEFSEGSDAIPVLPGRHVGCLARKFIALFIFRTLFLNDKDNELHVLTVINSEHWVS